MIINQIAPKYGVTLVPKLMAVNCKQAVRIGPYQLRVRKHWVARRLEKWGTAAGRLECGTSVGVRTDQNSRQAHRHSE